jgi:hypothetical protein
MRPLEGKDVFKRNPFRGERDVEVDVIRDRIRDPKTGKFGWKERYVRRGDPDRPLEGGRFEPTMPSRAGLKYRHGTMRGGDRAGIFHRNPAKSLYGGLALAGGGAAGVAGLLEPEQTDTPTQKEETVEEWVKKKQTQAKEASKAKKESTDSMGHRTEYLKKRRKRLKQGMKQLLNQYMILSYVNPDEADNFLKAGMKMMEADQDFNDDLQMQDAYDTVFQPGNMPASAREAFGMLLPLVGAEDAMDITEHYKDIAPEPVETHLYTKKEQIRMDRITSLYAAGTAAQKDMAIDMLAQMWYANGIPEHLEMSLRDASSLRDAAKKALESMPSLGGAAPVAEEGGGKIFGVSA